MECHEVSAIVNVLEQLIHDVPVLSETSIGQPATVDGDHRRLAVFLQLTGEAEHAFERRDRSSVDVHLIVVDRAGDDIVDLVGIGRIVFCGHGTQNR